VVALFYQAATWGGELLLWGEEVVQQDIVYLLRGLRPREEGKAGRGSAIGKLLGRPQGQGGGA